MKVVVHNQPPKRRKGRVRRLRTVPIFPSMLTLANMLCGFAAIYFCMRAMHTANLDPSLKATLNSQRLEEFLPTFISVGGFLIFLGMFFDMMDGRVARMTSGTSNFGGQLDSLADMVTFGVAPAMLMIALVTLQAQPMLAVTMAGNPAAAPAAMQSGADAGVVPADGSAEISPGNPAAEPLPLRRPGRAAKFIVSSRGAWMAGAIFAACCALRLARYNVEHAEGDLKHGTFDGLPSPGAAAVIASLVILYEHVAEVKGTTLVYALPVIAILGGLLMVSRVQYAHVGNRYLRGRKPFGYAVVLVVLAGLAMRFPAPTLATITCLYALTGPVGWAAKKVRRDRGSTSGSVAEAGPGSHSETGTS